VEQWKGVVLRKRVRGVNIRKHVSAFVYKCYINVYICIFIYTYVKTRIFVSVDVLWDAVYVSVCT